MGGMKIAEADNIAYGLFGFAATEKMHRAWPKYLNALTCHVVAREDIVGAVLSAPIAEAEAIPSVQATDPFTKWKRFYRIPIQLIQLS